MSTEPTPVQRSPRARQTIRNVAIAVLAGTTMSIAPSVAVTAAAAAGSDRPTALTASHGVHDADVQDDLAEVRRATARFHDVDASLEAGYELGWVDGSGIRIITGCVAHPSAGAIGYHYYNSRLMDDLAVNLLEPEVLVYAPGPQGQRHLAAVEWVARGHGTNPPGVSEPPTVLGVPMHILNPAVGFYLMHAWVWKPNPAGMFADWNPEVTCP
jgi:hypothetical protein